MDQGKQQILGIVETISRGFVRRGTLNNAKKRHLQAVMNVESKRWKVHYKPIYFIEEDFRDIDKEHDDPMMIPTLVHNFLVKRLLID